MSFYYNIYDNNTKYRTWEAQFVNEVYCGFGQPTRFNFILNTPIASPPDAYILVSDSTYEIPLSEMDKMLMIKLDSIASLERYPVKQKFSELKGWRKAKGAEESHPFVITK